MTIGLKILKQLEQNKRVGFNILKQLDKQLVQNM